jgi:DNA-binding NarL/FixJ family response regulator
MIRIVIADDLPRIRTYFETMISEEPDMEVLAVCKNGVEAVQAVREHEPDIVLLDIQMDDEDDGIQAAWQIKQVNPEICIIMLTIHKEDDLIFSSFEAGVTDYILKTEDPQVIMEAIRNAYRGQATMRPVVANKMRNEFARIRIQQRQLSALFQIINSLTRSELDILALYLEGMSYHAIAEIRFIERTTVRAHVSNILKKFKKRSMKEVAALLIGHDAVRIVTELHDRG